MKGLPELDPVLQLVDAVLDDLSVRTGMYVGRRREDRDAQTFVIQTGEEGRLRVSVPDLTSDESIEQTMADIQAHVARVLAADVPLCPAHPHALLGTASQGGVMWMVDVPGRGLAVRSW